MNELKLMMGYGAALLIGLVLGLVGGGGSILTVPLLVYLLGLHPVTATAYSLFIVGTSSMVGVLQKARKGLVDFKTGLAFCFPSFLAVYCSRRYLLPYIPETLFEWQGIALQKGAAIMILFALVMAVSAYSMIKKGKETNAKGKQPYYLTFVQGLFIGGLTGIIGAGGGFLYVPALVMWANLPMKQAVGTSLVIVTINSLIGFSGDLHTLTVDWPFLLRFTLLTIAGILAGGYLTKKVSNALLKKAFGYLVLLMSVFILLKETLSGKTPSAESTVEVVPAVTYLSPGRFFEQMMIGDQTIIDLREGPEFINGHLPAALFVGGSAGMQRWLPVVVPDKDTPLLVVAGAGQEVQLQMLDALGYHRVSGVLKGDLQDWQSMGYPLLKVESLAAAQWIPGLSQISSSLLDVRSSEEFHNGHLEGARWFALQDLVEQFEDKELQGPVYLYCAAGTRSLIATSFLEANGVSKVVNLEGGYQAYQATQTDAAGQ